MGVREVVSPDEAMKLRRLVTFAFTIDIKDATYYFRLYFFIGSRILVSSANIMSCLRRNCLCRSLRLATLISLMVAGLSVVGTL